MTYGYIERGDGARAFGRILGTTRTGRHKVQFLNALGEYMRDSHGEPIHESVDPTEWHALSENGFREMYMFRLRDRGLTGKQIIAYFDRMEATK